MKVLNLYAGIGGNRQLWEEVNVTAIEFDPRIAEIYSFQFPNDEIIIEDCVTWINQNQEKLLDFDFIWGSPPCITHTRLPQKHYFYRAQSAYF